MQGYRQFVLYRIVPSTTRPGKTDKLPIDPQTFSVCSAHDPKVWMDCATAAAMAEAMGADHGVGFVFTPHDPFWFMDIDNCAVDGGWSDTANNLLSWFPGAAVEVSVSGKGLHVFGCGAPPPGARKTRYHHFFEFYFDNRFAALGNPLTAIGQIYTDFSTALVPFVAAYLTPDASNPEDWRDGPVPEFRGPKDDDDLIRRISKSKSGQSAFGLKITPGDLFHADPDALMKFFPDSARSDGYDASSADMALAQHLAFWTGKDHERMRRLMERSALKRDKWEREDYLPRTIVAAVNRQTHVCQDTELEAVSSVPLSATGSVPIIQGPKLVTGNTYAGADDQLSMFAGMVLVPNMSRILTPGGFLMKPDQFRVMYGGYSFPMDNANERITRNAWEAVSESQLVKIPRANAVCFRPELPPAELIAEGGVTLVNMWSPIDVPSVAGDVGPFLRHIQKILPDERDRTILLSFMAALVQNPGVKFQWAPLLQGVPGNGKTMIITAVSRAVGDRYTHLPNAADLAGGGAKFTAWLQAKLFIGIEEIKTDDKRDLMDLLKPIITNSRIEIQAKGQDQITGDNRANVIACSNYKDAITKTVEDRRWAVFYTAQQEKVDLDRDGMAGEYMADLWDWFEGRRKYAGMTPGFHHVTHHLQTMEIAAEYNPATNLHRAPDTSSTLEAIGLSMGRIEQEIMEAIEEGRTGFAGGWVSSIFLDRLLVHMRADRAVPQKKRRAMMQSLGYDHHPAFTDGRVNNAIQPDMGKPRLYAKIGHINNQISLAAMAQKNYTDAQAAVLTAAANFGKQAT